MDIINIIFYTVLALAMAANIVLSVRGKTSVPLLYAGAILCVGIIALYPTAATRSVSGWSFQPRPFFGGCAAVFAAFFWDRLLLLKVHAPRARYSVFVLAFALLLPGLINQFPGVEPAIYNRLQSWAGVLFLPALIATGVLALRSGFRPALYSAIGLGIYILFAAVHLGVILDFLPHNEITGHSLQLGFLGQFLFFMASLSSRAAMFRDSGAQGENEGIRRYQEEFSRSKYEKSKLTGVDIESLHDKLTRLMVQERLYCDEDLNLERLARHCDVSRHELSEYLNNHLGMNFNRFVNDYRVDEARAMLLEQPKKSILDIAYAAGFNSKTRFNIEFKRVAGCTPSAFRIRAEQEPRAQAD